MTVDSFKSFEGCFRLMSDSEANAYVGYPKEKLSNVRDEEIKSLSIRGLKRVAYCKDSGKLFSSECSYDPRGDRIEYGYFEEGNLPSGFCDRHVLCYYDELTDGVATEFCPSENLKLISLLKINDRNFKKEIYISDADYVFMEMDEEAPLGDNYDIPYYFYMLEDGEFIGRGRRKKQFNSSCYIHSE